MNPAGRRATAPMAIAALGVVFGDIGTSPLYAFQQVFVGAHDIPVRVETVYGVLSLIFWTITLIVTVKYVLIVMRAANDGEGGIMALTALTTRDRFGSSRTAFVLLGLGVFGAALFYGDSMITPAVSVLSAVEGLEVVDAGLAPLVVPLALVLLVGLFLIQRLGTARVGGLFGPVMLIWFVAIGVVGLVSVVQTPQILAAISPTYALQFWTESPLVAFLSLGSVILCVTGAEALYADMGHFGVGPIRLSWLAVAAPALYLNYLGQAALVSRDPSAVANPFYQLVPSSLQLAMVVLATLATIIASQAVITGAFSMTQQAIRLRYLPRMAVRHTSSRAEGQIYVPAVNWLLMIAVIGLILGFQSSDHLASAYGLAVSGTFVITTVLITVLARTRWRVPLRYLIPVAGLFLVIDLSFFASNLTKLTHGAWFPLLVAGIVFILLMTWHRGRILSAAKAEQMSLSDEQLRSLVEGGSVTIIDGTTVYLTPDRRTPLALSQYTTVVKVFERNTLQLCTEPAKSPHVADEDRVQVEEVFPGFTRVILRSGFMDRVDIEGMLTAIQQAGVPIPAEAVFVVHTSRIDPTRGPGMMLWRKHLYALMARNTLGPLAYFHIRDRHVIEFTSVVRI